jgi:hypothetical protein
MDLLGSLLTSIDFLQMFLNAKKTKTRVQDYERSRVGRGGGQGDKGVVDPSRKEHFITGTIRGASLEQ